MTSTHDDHVGGERSSPPAVELIGITKHFGQIVACDRVNLTLRRGQIHGVLGENGAGKSTLMKVLIGLVLPDAGEVRLHGRTVQITDPVNASAHGIAMVHQHFSLVEALTVWENVALGDVGRLDHRHIRRRVGEISEHYGLHINPDDRIADLPAGMRQRVEIIKCLRRDPEVLVFDEPTSVLSPSESEFLFAALRRVVTEGGKAVALVSHKLPEILSVTDEVTIMRDGRVVQSGSTGGTHASALAKAMVGRSVVLRREHAAFGVIETDGDQPVPEVAAPRRPAATEPALRLIDLSAIGRDGRVLLGGLTLDVYPGEIVGVAGVEDNGQRTLGDVLSSLANIESGQVLVNGVEVATGKAGAMAKAGIAVIPEDRHDSGCVLDFTVAENLFIADPDRVSRRGLINMATMRAKATQLIEQFSINCTGPNAPMWSLSGGNQQRVVMARELSHSPKVLVAAQPTHGLDVGAIEYMSDQLRNAAVAGVGVLLISTELEEILDLSDRIVVIYNGRIIGEMPKSEVDIARLGLLMGGATSDATTTIGGSGD
ncbi:MAG: ABC transporter ATP-binding protein [Actinobacteria bacterium]|nr:ABC transporter ATP-binding protein [Actinomycetota bacterium]